MSRHPLVCRTPTIRCEACINDASRHWPSSLHVSAAALSCSPPSPLGSLFDRPQTYLHHPFPRHCALIEPEGVHPDATVRR